MQKKSSIEPLQLASEYVLNIDEETSGKTSRFLGNSASTDSLRQEKGEPGQAPVPTPTLETNKQTSRWQQFRRMKKMYQCILVTILLVVIASTAIGAAFGFSAPSDYSKFHYDV